MARSPMGDNDPYSVSALYQVAKTARSARTAATRAIPSLAEEIPWTSLHGVTKKGFDNRRKAVASALERLEPLVAGLEKADANGSLTPAESAVVSTLSLWVDRLLEEQKLLEDEK